MLEVNASLVAVFGSNGVKSSEVMMDERFDGMESMGMLEERMRLFELISSLFVRDSLRYAG